MISREKALQLTAIYLYISELYESELQFVCQRFSNNNRPEFTDQEIITIYLFVMHSEQRFKIKHIHQFAKDYLHSWFPKLPSYVAFNTRLNRMSEALKRLSDILMTTQRPDDCSSNINLLDSMLLSHALEKGMAKLLKKSLIKPSVQLKESGTLVLNYMCWGCIVQANYLFLSQLLLPRRPKMI